MIDPTTLLAELAAIQRDVQTVYHDSDVQGIAEIHAHSACRRIESLIASLMSSMEADHLRRQVTALLGERLQLMADIELHRADKDLAQAALRDLAAKQRDTSEDGRVHLQWTVHKDDADTAFVPIFGTIRVCRHCGCLVAGGPNACTACANAAPPPVDNGMLAPIRARLDRMEREIAKLDERIERDRFDLDGRVTRLEADHD